MRAIEAVVTDLDGTVVRRDGTVTPATLRAAAELKARGIPLIAATARTPTGLRALSDLAGELTFAVCYGGAVGVVPATGGHEGQRGAARAADRRGRTGARDRLR